MFKTIASEKIMYVCTYYYAYIYIYIYMYSERERDGESTLNLDIIWTSYSWTLNQYQLMNMNIISTCMIVYDIFFNRPMFVEFSIMLLSFTGRNGAITCVSTDPRQPSGRQSRSQMHVPAARPWPGCIHQWIWYQDEICYRILLGYRIHMVSYWYGIMLIRYQDMLIYTSIIHMNHI